MDSSTGNIVTTGRLDCDAGIRAYSFVLKATDNGSPSRVSTTNVGVILVDVNDSPPVFGQSVYHHRVYDGFPVGTTVATPLAYDKMDTINSKYRYRLEGPAAGMYFNIDPNTGVVRTSEMMSTISDKTVEYTVIAEDVFDKRLNATATLRIDIFRGVEGGGANSNGTCCCIVPC
jgi:hypothetical protein